MYEQQRTIPILRSILFVPTIVEQLKGLGMFGATIPQQYGGLDLPFTTYAAIVEELSRGWMSLGGILNTHTMISWMIKTYGSEEMKSRLLPNMATGERRCALCMTEPDAGSDGGMRLYFLHHNLKAVA